MLNNITIGQFFPGNSLLHRMDPRAKIIGTTIFVVAIFLANTPLAYGIVAAFTIGAMLLSRLPLRLMWNAIKPLWIIIVFTMGIHIFTSEEVERTVTFPIETAVNGATDVRIAFDMFGK